ncbi:unnamed protein product [Linum trigynum]|uniref:Uncharacterized protein n=1 Tax=Linum trigynum TaxID=586398 RepID=A0AAV2ES22_9ROSI
MAGHKATAAVSLTIEAGVNALLGGQNALVLLSDGRQLVRNGHRGSRRPWSSEGARGGLGTTNSTAGNPAPPSCARLWLVAPFMFRCRRPRETRNPVQTLLSSKHVLMAEGG